MREANLRRAHEELGGLMNFYSFALANLTCAVISAKWALDLGRDGAQQILWALAGALFGPLALLELYIWLLVKRSKELRESNHSPKCDET
jgi:hypothetical protein